MKPIVFLILVSSILSGVQPSSDIEDSSIIQLNDDTFDEAINNNEIWIVKLSVILSPIWLFLI